MRNLNTVEGVTTNKYKNYEVKILLIYHYFPDTFWSFKHALKFIFKKASSPPLGLLTVAAMLPAEWEKRLVDMNVSSLEGEDIRWADLVLISAMAGSEGIGGKKHHEMQISGRQDCSRRSSFHDSI